MGVRGGAGEQRSRMTRWKERTEKRRDERGKTRQQT